MNIFIDVHHSFIRQPIKIAIISSLGASVSFVTSEDTADLVIGTPDTVYMKPCILLSDNPHVISDNESCLAISPTPTNKSEMATLILRVADYLRLIS